MRVYVTGMGVVTSLGNTVDSMFSSLLESKTGVRQYPDWKSYKGLHCHLGAPAQDYDSMVISRGARRTMSRMSEMATLATLQALKQADIPIDRSFGGPRMLLIMGSTTGSPATLETYFKKLIERGGPEGQLATSFFKVMSHSVPANVAAALGFNGPLLSPSSACATSAQAMIMGWELIKSGLYDVVIAGGADELHYVSAAIFDIVQAASRGYYERHEETPRPFDKARDGLVVSEGSAVVVMESEASVKARGAIKIAEMRGGAYVCDGSHMTQSSATTMVEVMSQALDRADLNPSAIGYVNAHATGTLQGDAEEAQAIARVFGGNTPVSSLKAHFGHTLAACGTIEAVASIKMMEQGVLIPTRNLDEVDPACADALHLREKRPARVSTVLSNNFAFGGMNASLILSSP